MTLTVLQVEIQWLAEGRESCYDSIRPAGIAKWGLKRNLSV